MRKKPVDGARQAVLLVSGELTEVIAIEQVLARAGSYGIKSLLTNK